MDKVECPHCHKKFELSDAIAGPLVASAVAAANSEAEDRLAAERKQIRAELEAKAERAQADIVAALKRETAAASDSERAMSAKLAEAQRAQADALRQTRELEEARRELALTIEKQVGEKVASARADADRQADDRAAQRLAEKDQTIASMARIVEDLKRKAEQGSQQTQGESQELLLEAELARAFPSDSVEPVGKGIQGADCLLVVAGGGRILFESKATKAWSPGWLPKLRDDGRAAKADLLVLVTQALPKDLETAAFVDGVWVCGPKFAVPLTAALRAGLAEAHAARAAGQGLETKAGLAYSYLTGPQFKSRIAAIAEAFTTMKEDLDSEKRAIQKQWAKREAQIDRILASTAGVYGELQVIAGRSLAEIEGLSLKALEDKTA